MQQHEGPRRDRGAEEQARQAGLTRRLLTAIAILVVVVGVALAFRLL